MRDVLANRDTPTRKAYLRAMLASVEVSYDNVRDNRQSRRALRSRERDRRDR